MTPKKPQKFSRELSNETQRKIVDIFGSIDVPTRDDAINLWSYCLASLVATCLLTFKLSATDDKEHWFATLHVHVDALLQEGEIHFTRYREGKKMHDYPINNVTKTEH